MYVGNFGGEPHRLLPATSPRHYRGKYHPPDVPTSFPRHVKSLQRAEQSNILCTADPCGQVEAVEDGDGAE